jgi:flagellar biogenesis protein FliO
MSALRSTLRICALAFAATPAISIAAEPLALPAWPDQSPSVYTQPAAPVAEAKANVEAPPASTQPVMPLQTVTPAKFEAPAAPVAAIAAPPAKDPRRLTPPRDRHLPHAAKRTTDAASQLPSFGLPFDSLYTTGAALAIVIGLFLLSAALVRRGSKKSNLLLPAEVVSVLGRVPLTARQFAELVRVGNKLVLVSVTPDGAKPLTEITDAAEIDRLVGLCRQTTKGSSTDEFDKVFRQLAEETAPAGFLGNEVPQVDARYSAPADVYAAYRGGAYRA